MSLDDRAHVVAGIRSPCCRGGESLRPHPAQGPDRAVQDAGSCRARHGAGGGAPRPQLRLGAVSRLCAVVPASRRGRLPRCGESREAFRSGPTQGAVGLRCPVRHRRCGRLSRSFAAVRSPVPSGGSRRASGVVPVAQDGRNSAFDGRSPDWPCGAGLRLPVTGSTNRDRPTCHGGSFASGRRGDVTGGPRGR